MLVVAVAAIAILRYNTLDQSSWQGVGFGMFATHEYDLSRVVQAVAVVDGVSGEVPLPAGSDQLRERALVTPGGDALRQIAERILAETGATSVTVTVSGHDVEPGSGGLAVGLRRLRSVTVP